MKKYPNSLENIINQWRKKTRFEVFGLLLLTQKEWVSLEAMTEALGVPPSELLTLIQNDSWFMVGYEEVDRQDVWLAINPNREPLVMDKRKPGKLIRKISGGSQTRLTKSKQVF